MRLPEPDRDKIRSDCYLAFWAGETWLAWAAALVFAFSGIIALRGGSWWWWALAASVLTGLRWYGCWFFGPVPLRKRRM